MYLDSNAVQTLRGLMIFSFLAGLILVGVGVFLFVVPGWSEQMPAVAPVLLTIGVSLIVIGISFAITYLLTACIVLAIEQAATEIKSEIRASKSPLN
ncbi:hypothetical protein [Leucobacter chromiiresistens]|uniref:Uncharacterized protein n=1 Tax=Leucobacter chromiiresistens TaxID=1079994 RepID=A0A147EBK6_9MICO|nr:hypothetical protein [Leucobacter chromiiresistens]KTR81765.1 hypothetical protein NS354_12165 [Leucobacter chromiiresistens]